VRNPGKFVRQNGVPRGARPQVGKPTDDSRFGQEAGLNKGSQNKKLGFEVKIKREGTSNQTYQTKPEWEG